MEARETELLERLEFLKLCGKRDRDLIDGSVRMTLQDFIRIDFILHSLDFAAFERELFNTYYDGFHEEYEAYLTEDIEPQELASEGNRWLLNFVQQIEDEDLATRTARIFEITEW